MKKRPMKLLIGYDGSHDANAAIEDLTRAGLPANVEALITTVCDSPIVPPFASHDVIERAMVGDRVKSVINQANMQVSEETKEARELIVTADERLRSEFPAWQVRGVILAGDPALELVKKAEQWHADLIAVGSQGRSAIGRLILGSVSPEGRYRSTMLSPHWSSDNRSDGPQTPADLIGLNYSAGAEKAVRRVLMRAWPEGTELRIVTVDDGDSTITTEMLSVANQHVREDIAVMEGKVDQISRGERIDRLGPN